MPVIRSDQHQIEPTLDELRARLAQELQGHTTADPPVVHEVHVQPSNTLHVIVVWDRWADVPQPDRGRVIMDAYRALDRATPGDAPRADRITMAMGATWEETEQLGLLPFRITPNYRRGEVDDGQVREAMLRAGAVELTNGRIILAFAFPQAADHTFHSLQEQLPQAHWSLNTVMARVA